MRVVLIIGDIFNDIDRQLIFQLSPGHFTLFPQDFQIKHFILVGLRLNIRKNLGTQVIQVSIGRNHLEEVIKLLKVAVDGSLQFGVVVNVHLRKFSVLTVLRVELDELVKLEHGCWVLVYTDRRVFVLGQV